MEINGTRQYLPWLTFQEEHVRDLKFPPYQLGPEVVAIPQVVQEILVRYAKPVPV